MNIIELIFGKKEPKYPLYLGKIRKCSWCNGKGYRVHFGDIEDCFICKGTGKVQEKFIDRRVISKEKKLRGKIYGLNFKRYKLCTHK